MSKENILIIGGGTAGIKTALELATQKINTTIIDKSPFIVGKLSQLDKQFPTNNCSMCQMIPLTNEDNNTEYCLKRDLSNKYITLKPAVEIIKYEKTETGFNVKFKSKPLYVDINKCIACDKCTDVCPEKGKNEFEENLTKRKAIYLQYPYALPNSYVIDEGNCTKCGKCVDVCPTNAIDLEKKETEFEKEFSNIVITTGFELYEPTGDTEFGFGRFKNVFTSMQFERMLSPMGPYQGNLKTKFGKSPRIAFLQCIGSRTTENPYCSSACCMYSIKESMLLKELIPNAEISIFYMDLRTYGKGYYRYQEKAKTECNVKYINTRIANIEEVKDNKLLLKFENEEGKIAREEFDVAVLSTGQQIKVPEPFKHLTDETGFIKTEDFDITKTTEDGIFAVGSIISPVDIPDTVTQATAVVNEILKRTAHEDEKQDFIHVIDEKLGVFASNGLGQLDNEMFEYLKSRKSVEYFKVMNYFYLDEHVNEFISIIKENNLNRILLLVEDLTLDKELLKKKIFEKIKYYNLHVEILKYSAFSSKQMIKQILKIKLEKIRNESAFKVNYDVFKNFKVMVMGGGLTGVVITEELIGAGIKVDLIEKADQLGGNIKHVKTTVDNKDIYAYFKKIVEKIKDNELLTIYTSSKVTSIDGHFGSYQVNIKTPETIQSEDYSMLVIAVGGEENTDSSYGYGANKSVISQLDLSTLIKKKDFLNGKKSIAMIQCVNSRDESNPYCSRICCSSAIKNALKIKEKNPDIEIYILYRDVMTYGKLELKYLEAREKGIIFLKYLSGNEIKVNTSDDTIKLEFFESILKSKFELDIDLLVLSFGIKPGADVNDIAIMAGLPLTEDGFLKEANVKFRPVETEKTGILIAGLAHSPMNSYEAIQQAKAVVVRVMEFARKNRIRARDEISVISQRKCSGCQMCIEACPYEARYFDKETTTAVVINSLCQGCGLCTMTCPNNATELIGQETKTLRAIIDSII